MFSTTPSKKEGRREDGRKEGRKEQVTSKTVAVSPVGETGCQGGRKRNERNGFHSESCQIVTRRGNKWRKSLPVLKECGIPGGKQRFCHIKRDKNKSALFD